MPRPSPSSPPQGLTATVPRPPCCGFAVAASATFAPPLLISSKRAGRCCPAPRRWRASADAAAPAAPAPASAVVVGGGAAGFFTAVVLARALRAARVPAASVTILEASPRTLHKVRVSGGGRCNVTSARHTGDARAFAANYPRGRGRTELLGPLTAWSAADTVAWFEAEGVPLKIEASGKVFPVSDNSETIVEALHRAAAEAGVHVVTRARVVGVEYVAAEATDEQTYPSFQYKVHGEVQQRTCHCMCLCTGSSAVGHKWASSLRHRLVDPIPSLFTFKVANDPRLAGLAGVAVPDASARLEFHAAPDTSRQHAKKRRRAHTADDGLVQRGPVLITHWGLSGPAIIQLSSFAARLLHEHGYRAVCIVDFVPDMTLAEKVEAIRTGRTRLAQKLVFNACPLRSGAPPSRLWRSLLRFVGCDAHLKWADVSNSLVDRIAEVLHSSAFEVTGKGEFKEEFVTAGGVHTGDVSTKSFESKITPGLFFAGEVLNIDGKTGGYNFQNCWSTGYLAGTAMAEHLANRVPR
jgi:predicted Rossmann fold flavoprotein